MLGMHTTEHRNGAGVGPARTAIAAAAACIAAALLVPADAVAQKLPVQITGFGPFTIGMTVAEAKAAARRAKQQDCGEIAEDRQCLAMRAAVFNEPAMLYAVLDEEAKQVDKVVARLDPYRTHRRAYRCVRMSEKVFALLAVVYGSAFKQSYDEDRRPLPAVAWDGIREGRLIFETNCRNPDEGAPTITVVPLKQPDYDVAIGPGAADSRKPAGGSPATPPSNVAAIEENEVFQPGADTGSSTDEPEPKPDTAPRVPVTQSALPPLAAANAVTKTAPEPKSAATAEATKATESKAKTETQPKPATQQARTAPAGPVTPPKTESAVPPAAVASAPTQPATARTSDAPRVEPAKPQSSTDATRALRTRQVARLPEADSDTDLLPVDAPEPFDYADDDESDDLVAFEMPLGPAPPTRVALLHDASAVRSSPVSSTPVRLPTAKPVTQASARPASPPAKVAAPQPSKTPKAASPTLSAAAPASQRAKPAPKSTWRSTSSPVSLLPIPRAAGDKVATWKSSETAGTAVQKRGAGDSAIEIRPLSNSAGLSAIDGISSTQPAQQTLGAASGPANRERLQAPSYGTSASGTRSANLASLERATQQRAAPKEISGASAPAGQAPTRKASAPAARDAGAQIPAQVAAKPPASGNGPTEKTAAALRGPAVNEKAATTPKTTVASKPALEAKPEPKVKAETTTLPGDKRLTHRVAPNETVFSISRLYKVPIEALIRLNGIPPSNVILVGQTLVIPDSGRKPADVTRSADRDPSPEPAKKSESAAQPRPAPIATDKR